MNIQRRALVLKASLSVITVAVIVIQFDYGTRLFWNVSGREREWKTGVATLPAPHMYAPEFYNLWSGKPLSETLLVNCSDENKKGERQEMHIFVIEDGFTLGHMQMSFVQLFAWLIELCRNRDMRKSARTVYCVFEAVPNELHGVKDQYYLPFLRDIQAYAEHHLDLTLVLLDYQKYFANKTNILWCDMPLLQDRLSSVTVGRRNCEGRYGWGHCGAWYPSQDTVDAWRHFLATQVLEPIPSSQQRLSEPLQILILDRAPGYRRSLLNPMEVVNATREIFCPHNSVECNVNYTQLVLRRRDSYTWQWNCRFWAAGWDVVILVHGAALSNAVCLQNSTRALVEFVPRDNGNVSMYAPLLQQLGVLAYRTVRFRAGADNFRGMVQPELPAFRESLEMLVSWITSSNTDN
jgi:hypothetical protein